MAVLWTQMHSGMKIRLQMAAYTTNMRSSVTFLHQVSANHYTSAHDLFYLFLVQLSAELSEVHMQARTCDV